MREFHESVKEHLPVEEFTLNVLFLSELFYPHGGGAELATYLYAKLLSQAGVNVVVVTNWFAGEPETYKEQKLRIYRLPLFEKKVSTKYSIFLKIDALFSSFIRNLIRKTDVVYIPRFWYSSIPFAKLYRKPVVIHLHDYIPICPLSNLYDSSEGKTCSRRTGFCSMKCIYKWEKIQGRGLSETIYSVALNSTLGKLWGELVKLCDAIVCVSKTQGSIIAKTDPSLRSKIYTVYNPLPRISCTEIEGDDFGYFGGPNYGKGFHVLYHAVKSINSKQSKKINVHVTNFSNSPTRFLDKLCKTGFTPYGRLEEKLFEKIYRQLRCVVVPSIWPETFSYVVVEALLRGRLVIASDIGAIPEVTSGCDGALLFSAGSVEQLMARLQHVKDLKKEALVDLATRSRQIIAKRFDNGKTVDDFLNLLSMISGGTH